MILVIQFQDVEGEIDVDLVVLTEEMRAFCDNQLHVILTDARHDKLSRDRAISTLDEQMLDSFKDRCAPHKLRRIFTGLLKKSLK